MIATYPDAALAEAAWIDLLDPTPEEVERVREATGLRVPTKHEVSEIESSSRLGFEKGAYYVSTPLVVRSESVELNLAPVGLVLSARVLLTVRFSAIAALDEARLECMKAAEATAEATFIRILETVVDRAADGLEHAGNECDALSRAVFHKGGRKSDGLREAMQQIGLIANRTTQISDALLGVGRIAAFVTESSLPGAPAVNAGRMKAVRTDIVSLADYETRLSTNMQFMLDATLGFISIEQNEIVKTLTIASVVGVPPVLVAGIYGMNFRFMPELSWQLGYPLAIVLIVVSALLPLLWFKKHGWM
jgi:magnesium transporter